MSAINVKIRVTVDPAGRVLVWENERVLPSDRIVVADDTGSYEQDISGRWNSNPGCVTYVLDVMLPTPALPAPSARVVPLDDLHGKVTGLGPKAPQP